MNFSFKLIRENLDIYLSTFLYMSIFSFFILKDLVFNINQNIENISHVQKEEFIPVNGIKVVKNDGKFEIDNLQEFEKVVGEFDQIIKQTLYRIEFSALIKNGENISEVRGIGLDIQAENNNLEYKLKNLIGSFHGFSVSKSIADSLANKDQNNSFEMYLFGKDSVDSAISLFPIKIGGVFDGIQDKLILVPLKMAKPLLKSDQYDYAIIEFNNIQDFIKNEKMINESLEKIGYKIINNIIKNEQNLNIFTNIYLLIMFAVSFLALRDSAILHERIKRTKEIILLYGWKKTDVLKIFFMQNILPIILYILIWLAISFYINYQFWYILMPVFILYLSVILIFFVIYL